MKADGEIWLMKITLFRTLFAHVLSNKLRISWLNVHATNEQRFSNHQLFNLLTAEVLRMINS